ncbi:MAG: CRTAC1 family protein [Planctomycetes bacterium]|nr:CRTAC1 family protein [Planctomycetota bacterium]
MNRWAACLVLVSLGAGCTKGSPDPRRPELAAGPNIHFEEATPEAGLNFTNVSGSPEKYWITDSTAGGGAVLDFDGDGFMDLYLVSGSRWDLKPGDPPPINRLFRNRGDGTFEDATARSGAGDPGWGQGAVAADYDGDGDPDLYVTNIGANRLFRNEGSGVFTDVTSRAGVPGPGWSTGAAFADADGDGDLDLFVVGYVAFDPRHPPNDGKPCAWQGLPVFCGPQGLPGERDIFYRSRGDGTFEEAVVAAGLGDQEGHYGFQPVFFDYDLDGDPDLFVANDSRPNSFYENRGNGTFQESAVLRGVAYNEGGRSQASMGVAVGDADGDGRLDLYVTNFDFDTNTLYKNNSDGFFEDVSTYSGVGPVSYRAMGWGAAFADFDNDGDLDLISVNGHLYPAVEGRPDFQGYEQRHFLFANDGRGRFAEGGEAAGITRRSCGRGVLVLDLENDGDLDLVILSLDGAPLVFKNETAGAGHWLKARPVGAGKNRDAVGARVTVRWGGRRSAGEVRRGEGYLSSMDPRPHFGLGAWTGPVQVEVRFRSGRVKEVQVESADRLIEVHEK